jgi:hypothetical protein
VNRAGGLLHSYPTRWHVISMLQTLETSRFEEVEEARPVACSLRPLYSVACK